jgi:N-methylhydantoinase A/oxoprolinase/acetone carboxylase beta subunit
VAEPRYRLGVDVGGTFTDLLLVDLRTRRSWAEKVLTTPDDPSAGVARGVAGLLSGTEVALADVADVVHATTLVGNAVIERKGCRVALLTTEGFRDVLGLGRESRYDIYERNLAFPEPLVRRRDRLEVRERVTAAGEVAVPLDAGEVTRAVDWLRAGGYQAVAIVFLHAYRDPGHERRLAEAVRAALPSVAVSLSSDVLPQLGEYERSVATVINAYVQPLVRGYLDRLRQGLGEPAARRLGCVSSSGGWLTPEIAARYPVRLLESGPAAGALAAAHQARQTGRADLLSFDMGGTTAKACLVRGGEASLTHEFEVARLKRLTRGSGLPVRLPGVDLLEVGAGGGSIAHLDELGLLAVGPESAGARPGPVCYGHGGSRPTVTDANLVLGYLGASSFLGGDLRLDAEASRRAYAELGRMVGLDEVGCAWGAHEIASQNMANALRTYAVEKGVDYRRFAMIAFGGAGPTHAYRIAGLLHIPRVVLPAWAGVYSALGLLTVPFRFETVRTQPVPVTDYAPASARRVWAELEGEVRAVAAEAGVDGQVGLARSLDMRYRGQGAEVEVAVRDVEASSEELAAAFDRVYERQHGWRLARGRVEIVNWRCVGVGRWPDWEPPPVPSSPAASPVGSRSVYLSDRHGFVDTPIYERRRLGRGTRLEGPALVEERECTTFVGPGASAAVDEWGNLIMEMEPDPEPTS